MYYAVSNAAGLASDDVADGNLRAAVLLRLLHRRQRVHRLAGLTHRNHERFWPNNRLPVAKLRGVVHLRRNPCDPLDIVASDHRRVQARAHADEDHAPDRRYLRVAQPDVLELNTRFREQRAAAQCVQQCFGLLRDLLLHEVLITAFCG